MFLFNKGHGQQRPGSRQSFFDSHGPDPSTAQHWDRNPPLDASGEEHQRPPSSSGQERGIIGKRTSLLPMRSRSDTATSAASNVSHTSGMASSDTSSSSSSKRLSQDLRLLNPLQSGRADAFEVKPKTSLFSRGKILKRTSRIGPELNVNGEHYELGKRLSVLRRDGSKKTPRPQESSNSTLRHRISSPFDFQHLTHTAREHISALDSASQSDLAAEFMAVRHSQMPRRELNGIRVEDLAIGQGSTHSLPEVTASTSEGSFSSPSPTRLSPVRSRDQVFDGSLSPTPSRKGSLKQSRSVESFSQPKIRSSARVSMGIAPPPRLSSRTALTRIDDEDGSSSTDGLPRRAYNTHRYSGIWSPPVLQHQFAAASPAPCIPEDEDEDFAHAVTTVGDAAVPTLSPAFALENVPEEPESYFNPRPAPQPPVRQSSLFGDLKSPDLRQLTESPQLINRLSTQSTIKPSYTPDLFPRSDSRASTTLGPAFNPRPRFGSPPKVASLRRQSLLQEFDACWEDDIDYCYDHAAEADCDYDWDRNSLDIKDASGEDGDKDSGCHTDSEAASSVHGLGLIAEEEEDDTMRNHFFGGNFRPSLLVPETSSLPDLVQRSSLSPSTTEPSLRTPSDASQQTPSILTPSMPYYDNGFAFHPPLLLPQEAKFPSIRDDMYDELLAEYQSSEKHFPILDGSSVSSATRLSKRSSYDSSIRSGSGSLYSTMRRSASSAGSLPDLVHSRRSTKRVVEVLADQMTFANLDSDDVDDDDRDRSPTPEEDDSTPTNITEAEDSTSSERTFFATEDEETPSEAPSVVLEDTEEIVREPVRRVPTPPPKVSASSFELDLDTLPPLPVSPAPMVGHHERAASESTAKLMSFGTSSPSLSPTQMTRQRSASHSKARRGTRRTSAYTLSLFPPPPKDGASPVIPSLPTMS